MKQLFTIFILTLICLGQEDIDLFENDFPALSDSLIAPIPGDPDTLEELLTDTLVQDSLNLSEEDSLANDTIVPIDNGFSFGARWGFSSAQQFQKWGNSQRVIKREVDTLLSIAEEKFKTSWQREPRNQSIAFPLTLGYFNRIDSVKSVTFTANYSFRTKLTTFAALEDSTNNILYEHNSRLTHHRFDISASYDIRINPEYFAIENVSATGVSLGVGVIPLSCFLLNTTSNNDIYTQDVRSFGIGATWNLSIFTEKQNTSTVLTRLFFNYNGSYQYGFKNHNELFGTRNTESYAQSQMGFSENFFELGFLFTFSKESDTIEE